MPRGRAAYDDVPTEASWKTIKRLVSSIHLILKPPPTFSHSENATCMSLVLSSLAKPVRCRMRVTEADSPEVDAEAIFWELSKVADTSEKVKNERKDM